MLVNCSVCLGDINLLEKEVSITNCGHFFHPNCLNNWLGKKRNCPECRTRVKSGTFPNSIYPKINKGTVSQLKDENDELRNENNELRNENVNLKMMISSCTKHVSQLKILVYSDTF